MAMAMAMEEEEEEGEVQKLLSCTVDPAQFLGSASSRSSPTQPGFFHNERDDPHHTDGLKLYQIRAQDLLHSYLDKTIAITLSDSDELIAPANWCTKTDEVMSSIRLFRHAPSGILLTSDEPVPRKIIHSSSSSDEDSIESLARLKAAVVDGSTVQLEAIRAAERALRAAEKDSIVAEIAAKKEEERVTFLKKQRGEAWLPSLTNEMTTWKNF